MYSENISKNIGVSATKVFIFIAITISIMAILNGADIISSNIASIIQALSVIPILILVVSSNNRFSITFVFALVISIMICIINGAIYMISGTMMMGVSRINCNKLIYLGIDNSVNNIGVDTRVCLQIKKCSLL